MITDWDDAYANRAHVPGAEAIIARWNEEAREFRDRAVSEGRARLDLAYGDAERQKCDLFTPGDKPRGLAIFIHGGYWQALDKSCASHLAAGALARGWAFAVPGYTLCPEARIGEITREIAAAVEFLGRQVEGPVAISGHSAGGHLAARMACTNATIAQDLRGRISRVLSISGVHDLRPLLRTQMNSTLQLDQFEAEIESPALLRPVEGIRVSCWVGADERPEFVRQNALLANIWTGLGADTSTEIVSGRHHFDVIAALCDPDSEMTRCLLN